MGATPAPRDQWYVIHVRSGFEQKVRDSMLRRIQTEEMGDYIYEVLVPTERVSEVKKGKRFESNRKFFPGYVIANCHLLDEHNRLVDKTWYFVKETDGVLNFAGTNDHPIAMRQREVDGMLAQVRDKDTLDSITGGTLGKYSPEELGAVLAKMSFLTGDAADGLAQIVAANEAVKILAAGSPSQADLDAYQQQIGGVAGILKSQLAVNLGIAQACPGIG